MDLSIKSVHSVMNRRPFFCSFFVITLLFISQSGCSFGQQRNFKNTTPEQRAEFQTRLMKEKLDLDAGQLAKVKSINLKYAQKFQPIIESKDSRPVKLQQVTTLQQQKDKELQQVFNKDQFAKYQAFEQKIRKKMREAVKNQ